MGGHTNNNLIRIIICNSLAPIVILTVVVTLRHHNFKPTKLWLTRREEVLAEVGSDPAAIGEVIADAGVDDEDPVEAETNRKKRNGNL